MNKDVIYIEPEDDITDIISKLETAKEKIVALVPPKKSTVLRSAVNIKLISKAGANASKNIVLVTTDPSIIKLAANIKIPVTKNLQSAPSIPTEDDVKEEVIEEEITEDTISDKVEGKDEKVEEEEKTEEEEKAEEVAKEIEKEEEKDDKKAAKPEKAPKEKKEKAAPKNPVLAWIVNNKKWVGIGSGVLALLVIFLVWAFVFAPAVKINVAVRTNSNNFSEMISFTNDQTKEDVESGVFYLEEIKTEQKQKAEFTATGTKNVGEKAKGQITIIGMLREDDIHINTGTVLRHNDLVYYTTEDAALLANESTPCENKDQTFDLIKNGCKKSVKIGIVAAEPGEKYNIEEGAGNWVISANVSAYTESGVTGGTDKNVIVVTEENVDVARGKIASGNAENLEDTKNALKEQAGDRIIIESSFKQEMSEPEVSPKVGEEVPSDTIPSITLTTTTSYFAIDKTKVEEFITNKAKIPEDQKIYAINNPFIESFMVTDSAITGKIKTSYSTGSKLTENDILEMVKGKGIGDVQHTLKSVSGVSKVSINQSYPWVNTVPTDSNKITIELTIEETNSQNKE